MMAGFLKKEKIMSGLNVVSPVGYFHEIAKTILDLVILCCLGLCQYFLVRSIAHAVINICDFSHLKECI